MNSFVTGGSGFVGGNLIRLFLETGHSVRAMARSQSAQEAVANRLVLSANSNTLRTAAVRPPTIWGFGDRNLLPRIMQAVHSKQFLWINRGFYPYETCHVRNACEGALLASEKGEGDQAYFLIDTEKRTFREFIVELLATQEMTPGELAVPRLVAWVSAAFLEGLWRLLHLRGRPPITPTLLALIGVPIELSDAKARTELGYNTVHVSRPARLEELRHAFIHPSKTLH